MTGGMLMPYVDGFIVAVPKKNLEAYRSLAKKAGKVWREHGALEYCEWIADDVQVGKRTSFPRSVKLKPGETVIFSWITYKSRAQRDRVNAKVMADKRLAGMMDIKSLPSDATIPSPSAGSLEMAAASNVPNAPPAICAKPSRAAATPALLPNGDSAAALDSGVAMPNPSRKIAVAVIKDRNEPFATSPASSSVAPPMTVIARPTTVAR